MSPNVTNNVTNKNLREEPNNFSMVGTNVTNNVTNKKQSKGIGGIMSPR